MCSLSLWSFICHKKATTFPSLKSLSRHQSALFSVSKVSSNMACSLEDKFLLGNDRRHISLPLSSLQQLCPYEIRSFKKCVTSGFIYDGLCQKNSSNFNFSLGNTLIEMRVAFTCPSTQEVFHSLQCQRVQY